MGKVRTATNSKTDEVYDAIIRLTAQNNVTPTVRELCKELGFASTCSAAYHIQELIRLGKITRDTKKSRSINIVNKTDKILPEFTRIPLVGTITAGVPITATEEWEDIYNLPNSLFRGEKLFMLHVKGESMIEAGINDGDLIIIRQQSIANNGDIVAALLDDSATVKRFFKESNRYRLQPENVLLKPIYCDHVDILGVVVGLIRKY